MMPVSRIYLRHLIFFFNNHTEWREQPDFYRDFSQHRLQEVRRDTIKGKQFISVKVWFNRPSSYSNSLPERFAVKRTWDRNKASYNQRDYLDTKEKRGKLPTSLNTAKGSLARLLNKIQFEYVPAVKDRSYFEHLLDRLQGILLAEDSSEDVKIAGTAEALADHVDAKIGDLQQEFKDATGIHTELEPPTDIASLFRAFGVSTSAGDTEEIPLKLRGDGIQARYVPSVLNYIAERSGKIFIWGFEEPENSLEYGRVSELADGFARRYANNAQVFVTSHSPAFTSMREDNVRVFRAYKDDEGITSAVALDEDEEELHTERLRDELGLLEIEKEVHDKYVDLRGELEIREKRIEELQENLARFDRPVVVVEGKWDKHILEEAWSRLRDDGLPFNIVDADPVDLAEGGGGGADALRGFLSSKFIREATVVGLFDRDHEGIGAYDGLPNYFDEVEELGKVKKHESHEVYGVLLPTNEEVKGYAKYRNLCIEFLFPDSALDQVDEQGRGLEIRSPQASLQLEERRIQLDEEVAAEAAGGEFKYCRKIEGGKEVFARKVVPRLDDEDFYNFEHVLSLLERLTDRDE